MRRSKQPIRTSLVHGGPKVIYDMFFGRLTQILTLEQKTKMIFGTEV